MKKHLLMRRRRLVAACASLAGLGCIATARTAMVHIDMDPGVAGIQTHRTASAGDSITVDLLLAPDAAGVSSYSISVRYDNVELEATAQANTPPGGFGFIPMGALAETDNIVAGQDQVGSFSAGTFGAGPVAGLHLLGSITFTVGTVNDDGLLDVTPGLYAGGDAMFDNSLPLGLPVVTTFHGGYLIPEPASMATVTAVCLAGTGLWLRRRRSAS